MQIVARSASSLFSRGVELSEPPGNRCKIRCFSRNHLGAWLMIPCRETIWGRARSPGVSLRSTARLNLDYPLNGDKTITFRNLPVGACVEVVEVEPVHCIEFLAAELAGLVVGNLVVIE